MDPTAWLSACGIGGSIVSGMEGSMNISMAIVMAISMDDIVVNYLVNDEAGGIDCPRGVAVLAAVCGMALSWPVA